MSNDVILKKMRAANIPPSTFKTTLEMEGHHSLRAALTNKDYRLEDGRLVSYVIHADSESDEGVERSFNAASLFAKELVLHNQPVYLLTIISLAREIRLHDYTVDDEDRINPIFSRQGHGFFVIPDFERYEVIENASNQRESMDWLAQHVQRGGGLVIASPKYRPVNRREHQTFADVANQFQTFVV